MSNTENNALGLGLTVPAQEYKGRYFSILGHGLPEGFACRSSPRHKVRLVSAPAPQEHKSRPRSLSLSAAVLSPASDASSPSFSPSAPSSSSSSPLSSSPSSLGFSNSKESLDLQFDFPFPSIYIQNRRYSETQDQDDQEEAEKSWWSPSTAAYDSPTLGTSFADDESRPSAQAPLSRHPALGALSPKSMALALFDTLSTEELKATALDFGWLLPQDEAQSPTPASPITSAAQPCQIVPLTQSQAPEADGEEGDDEDAASCPSTSSPLSAPSMSFSLSSGSDHTSATSVHSTYEAKPPTSVMDRARPLPRSVSTCGLSFVSSAKHDQERMHANKRRAFNSSLLAVMLEMSHQGHAGEREEGDASWPAHCGPPLAIHEAPEEDELVGLPYYNDRQAQSPRCDELARVFQERPLPPLPVDQPSNKLKSTGKAVAKWFGGLRKVKSHANLVDEAAQDEKLWQTKEPTVRRAPSIEQMMLS